MADRILADTPATFEVTFYTDGAPANDSPVTVTVTRGDGTAIVTDAAATNPGTGRYQWSITAAQAADLDHLTLTWVGASGQRQVTRAEIVGGFYVSLAALRALPNLSDTTKFTTAELVDARTWFETTFEDYTGVAWVPRYRRVTLNGSGTSSLLVADSPIRTVRSVRVYSTATTYTTYTAAELADIVIGAAELRRFGGSTWTRGNRNIIVEYEHGHDAPPSDVVQAARVAIRDYLLTDNVGNRQYSVATEAGIVRSSLPGEDRPFGIPFCDAVANRRKAGGGVGSVVVA